MLRQQNNHSRQRFNLFKDLWKLANNLPDSTTSEMDKFLHGERTGTEIQYLKFDELPDGVMVENTNKPFVVFKRKMYEWTFGGYLSPVVPSENISHRVLTPVSIIKTIQAGFQPIIILGKAGNSD